MFTSPLDPQWKDVLQLSVSDTEKVRGKDEHPAPLIRYHGTSMEAYSNILKTGLRPTKRLGMVGNNLHYFGHYIKALRYSFQDSQRERAVRDDPVLLRYALFVRPDEVLRVTEGRSRHGTIHTRPLTAEDIASIPERNRGFVNISKEKQDATMVLYGSDAKDKAGPYRVMVRDEPFASFEDARKALFVGD